MQRIRVRKRRGSQKLTRRRNIATEMMRETVGVRRRMLSTLQATIEEATAEVVAIANRLYLRDHEQYKN